MLIVHCFPRATSPPDPLSILARELTAKSYIEGAELAQSDVHNR